MFHLYLVFNDAQPLYGIKALDERRRLGLSDDTVIGNKTSAKARSFEVDEAFARTWFDGKASGIMSVKREWLVAEEVALEIGRSDICLSNTISVDRAKDLFVRGLVERLTEYVAELTATLEALNNVPEVTGAESD